MKFIKALAFSILSILLVLMCTACDEAGLPDDQLTIYDGTWSYTEVDYGEYTNYKITIENGSIQLIKEYGEIGEEPEEKYLWNLKMSIGEEYNGGHTINLTSVYAELVVCADFVVDAFNNYEDAYGITDWVKDVPREITPHLVSEWYDIIKKDSSGSADVLQFSEGIFDIWYAKEEGTVAGTTESNRYSVFDETIGFVMNPE